MKPAIDAQDGAGRQEPRRSTIRVMRRYAAAPERVFDAWLDPVVARRWLFATASRPLAHVEIDARVAGCFCFVERRARDVTRYRGEYIEIVPHRRLVFTLCSDAYPRVDARVRVDIAALAAGCELRLTQQNVPADHAEHIEGRWTGMLYGLGVTLDSALALQHDQE